MTIIKPSVAVIDSYGSDMKIAEFAGICHDSGTEEKDVHKRIKFLINHGHESPFERAVVTFEVKCSVPCARQWFRHRLGSPQEFSGRYNVSKREYIIPESVPEKHLKIVEQQYKDAELIYMYLINEGVHREDARYVLPQGMAVNFYWQMNLRAWFNFLLLRNDFHAQDEIHRLADEVEGKLYELYPITMKYWREKNGRS